MFQLIIKCRSLTLPQNVMIPHREAQAEIMYLRTIGARLSLTVHISKQVKRTLPLSKHGTAAAAEYCMQASTRHKLVAERLASGLHLHVLPCLAVYRGCSTFTIPRRTPSGTESGLCDVLIGTRCGTKRHSSNRSLLISMRTLRIDTSLYATRHQAAHFTVMVG